MALDLLEPCVLVQPTCTTMALDLLEPCVLVLVCSRKICCKVLRLSKSHRIYVFYIFILQFNPLGLLFLMFIQHIQKKNLMKKVTRADENSSNALIIDSPLVVNRTR